MSENILGQGIGLIVALQSLGLWLEVPMEIFSFLGTEEFYLLIMPALYWCVDRRLGVRMGVILLLSGAANNLLKLAFHSPRPYWYSPAVRALSAETSFGVPSGHAQNGVAIWGLLAASLRRGWAWIAAVGLIFFIGVSRVYLAVHFPSDVLIGWLIGAAGLALFLGLERPVSERLSQMSLAAQTTVALGVSLLLILVGALVVTALSAWELPQAWAQTAGTALPGSEPIDPLSLSGLITASGAFFGFAAGASAIGARGGFSTEGSGRARLLRYALGSAGVIVTWAGLGAVFPEGSSAAAYFFRFVRYSLVAGWISALAPMLFIRLGLAEPSTN